MIATSAILLALMGTPATAVCNVRDFGASGGGLRKDTAAIRHAIEACYKAGGGTVYLPPGRYLTGAIELKSHVALEIEAGATLLGSEDPADYPLRRSHWGDGAQLISALLHGEDLVNVSLRGRGAIDGQGAAWWKRHRDKAPEVRHGRPHLIQFVRCKHVSLEGLTLVNSPSWTVNPVFCEFVRVNGLTILNPERSPNTDGINPESCRNVHISNCHIDVGDDCVTIKSGKDELGRRMGRPCEDITVTNCTMLHGHGGVVIGSEMSGGARNISVSNCVFQGTQRGIRIKSQRGRGGVVEGVAVNNIVMHDVPEAFSITMYYSGKSAMKQTAAVDEGTPIFRDILLSNITARGSKVAGEIAGLREMPVSAVRFSNVRIAAEKGFSCMMAKDIAFHDVQIDTAAGPALTVENTSGLEIEGFRTSRPHAGAAVLDLRDAEDVFVRGSWAAAGTDVFLRVRGAQSRAIRLSGNDLSRAAEEVVLGDGAGAGIVRKD